MKETAKGKYYTPYEVAMHNTAKDCWVSFLGGVYNVTEIVADSGVLAAPILKAAGTDISHWFDAKTGDIRFYVCPDTNIERPYLPQGDFVDVPPFAPRSDYDNFGTPWWKDSKHRIGNLSKKTRLVRWKNVLTSQEDTVEVPSEETVGHMRERYMAINLHARSYTIKALLPKGGSFEFRDMDLNKTLEENGVVDETGLFEDLHVPATEFIPVLHAYWNDDLTTA